MGASNLGVVTSLHFKEETSYLTLNTLACRWELNVCDI
ncbi:hypothetical protein JOC94_004478 [Bacillus thermophilus]|uniref:Uncharacterized protein n=1 Tax=Siminovitchia thermophila TaxID=1245522 RepID=A0ABS2RDN2_9BACI|nr:hypothetical protein [Siminovitchia thermophila]